jgi:hypothetical protein
MRKPRSRNVGVVEAATPAKEGETLVSRGQLSVLHFYRHQAGGVELNFSRRGAVPVSVEYKAE